MSGSSGSRDLGIAPVPQPVREQQGFAAEASSGYFMGLSTFRDPTFAEIPFAADDAVDMAWMFGLELGLIHPSRITIALTKGPRKEASQQRLAQLTQGGAVLRECNVSEVYEGLERACAQAEQNGLLVIMLATHGLSQGGADYLIADDSKRTKLAQTTIDVAAVLNDLSAASARRRILLLDACRERVATDSRAISGDPLGTALHRAIANSEGQVVLCGTTLGGYAYDDAEKQNGVFTAALLEGLSGSAPANADGLITVESLARHANQHVKEWIRRHRPDRRGIPDGIEARLSGEAAMMPLAYNRSAGDKAAVLRARVQEALRLLDAARRADSKTITLTMVAWVEAQLAEERISSDLSPEQLELIEQLEELTVPRPTRVKAFAGWIQTRRVDSVSAMEPVSVSAVQVSPVPAWSAAPAAAAAVRSDDVTPVPVGELREEVGGARLDEVAALPQPAAKSAQGFIERSALAFGRLMLLIGCSVVIFGVALVAGIFGADFSHSVGLQLDPNKLIPYAVLAALLYLLAFFWRPLTWVRQLLFLVVVSMGAGVLLGALDGYEDARLRASFSEIHAARMNGFAAKMQIGLAMVLCIVSAESVLLVKHSEWRKRRFPWGREAKTESAG